jgi:hypothetical protein
MPNSGLPRSSSVLVTVEPERLSQDGSLAPANIANWSVHLQYRRLESSDPEDAAFVLRRWADFDFMIVALIRLRRAAQLAAPKIL